MRKSLLVPSVVAIAAVAVALVASAGAKGTRTIKVNDTVVGGSISDTRSAFSVRDSYMGKGAGIQTTKLDGNKGTDKTIVYYGTGTASSTDTFTIGQPDASGIASLTGSGHDVRGTGRLKGISSTYTFSGTLDTKTLRFTVKLKGTYKLPR